MARITIEDCLKKVPSRFLLVNMVAKRVRQIREGSDYLVSSPKNEDIVVSLREISAGRVSLKMKEPEPEKLEAPPAEAEAEAEAEAGAEAEAETEAEADNAAEA